MKYKFFLYVNIIADTDINCQYFQRKFVTMFLFCCVFCAICYAKKGENLFDKRHGVQPSFSSVRRTESGESSAGVIFRMRRS